MIYDFSPSCHDRAVISQYPPYKDLVKKVECVSCVGEDIEKCIIEFFSNNQNDVIEVIPSTKGTSAVLEVGKLPEYKLMFLKIYGKV